MDELRDLNELQRLANQRFRQYDGKDFVLPDVFKQKVTEINGNLVTYNKFSAIIETKGSQNGALNIFMPNQWFYIASYFTDFYNELLRYKKEALKVATKERLKELNNTSLSLKERSNLDSLSLNSHSKQRLEKFITDYNWWCGAKTIDRGDFYISPILYSARLVNASQSFVAELCAFLSDKQDLVQAIIEGEENFETNSKDNNFQNSLQHTSTSFRPYITAIKSKPFLLLAGISGTGKSRIVRELARACWDDGSEEYETQKPKNFEMVQVKPNWHDSSELIGYVSRVSGEPVYVAGDFLKFVAKAWEEPDVPYFLCLDEMNLAPVEQYFAEFLSVVESRKADSDGNITTDPILKKSKEDWYRILTRELTDDDDVRRRFLEDGICIPQNLIVVGTVNMDETTFSFSRKVLDRAMTIEMNEVDLKGGLDSRHEKIGKLGADELIGNAVEGVDIYEAHKDVCDKAIAYLQAINDKLEGTPFKIAYRTRNEVLFYVVNNLPYKKDDEELDDVINRALDEITSMKILSRIEGDADKIGNLLEQLTAVIKEELGDKFNIENSVSLKKLEEMEKKFKSGYTSFWS